MLIGSIDIEINDQTYRVDLYRGKRACVSVIKHRYTGRVYLSALKPNGRKFREVLRETRRYAFSIPGNLNSEIFVQYEQI
jgi:hypothetical protein